MKIVSLLIGISKYDSEDIQNLPYCQNDIAKTKDSFREILGIPPKNMLVQSSNTSRLEILKNLRKINLIGNDADLLIIYFTGHGTSISGVGYIIPSDTELSMIDSCYSGVNIGKHVSNPDFIDQLVSLTSEGWTILSSSKGNESSYFIEDKKMSVFSFYFNESLIEHSSKVTEKGDITLDDIINTTTKKITEWSLESNKIQTPTLNSQRVGYFTLPIKHKIVEINTDEKDTNIYPTEISLKHHFLISSGYYTYGYSSRMVATISPNGFEKKWASYSDEERLEEKSKTIKEKLEKINGCLLDFITPSQIKLEDNSSIIYPFGVLHISERETFNMLFKLSIDTKSIDNKTNEILKRLDDQDIINWETLLFKYAHKLDFDKVLEIAKRNNYKIQTFDILNSILAVDILIDDETNLEMIFTNIDDECTIEIREREKLRKDFFEVVPVDKMIEIFSSAII